MPFDQSTRIAGITTPAGENVLVLQGLTVTETLGRLPTIEADLLSEKGDIEPKTLLGQAVSVRLNQADKRKRYFHGYVIQFGRGPKEEQYFSYRATIVPWFWFLTRTSDCRVFQNKTVPTILKDVCNDCGFTDYEFRLRGNYTPWEYCVQYRETDFNFLSRLMEQEGIYYFFRYEAGKNVIVFADTPSCHEPLPGYEQISYRPSVAHGEQENREHIREFTKQMNHVSGTFAHTDYDMEKPKVNLKTDSEMPGPHALPKWEVFDYPGEYFVKSEGEDWARVRMEEIQAQRDVASGWTDSRGIATGFVFQLTDAYYKNDNGRYVVTSAKHVLRTNEFQSQRRGAPEWVYGCQFMVQDADRPFRAPRVTPKPLVHGIQTAVVVGPAGEEIYVDKYSRIKVQFHWDRQGRKDENSSCFVRVAQAWAGKQWGMIHIPRIGQEVVVAFLEGDPDQPLVIGSVYNADQMPPYELPANKTQSGIKSRSSLGGSPANFNEIRFEDKKGQEQVFIHAEKNMDIEVENDETHWVGHDRTKTIDRDETTTVKRDRTETVMRNETITIGKDRTETVTMKQSVTIGLDDTLTVGTNRSETIGINYSSTVGASESHTVGGSHSLTVGASSTWMAGATISITAGGAITITAPVITLNASAITLNAPMVAIAGRPVRPPPPPTPIM